MKFKLAKIKSEKELLDLGYKYRGGNLETDSIAPELEGSHIEPEGLVFLNKIVLIVDKDVNKVYTDSNGIYWVKQEFIFIKRSKLVKVLYE